MLRLAFFLTTAIYTYILLAINAAEKDLPMTLVFLVLAIGMTYNVLSEVEVAKQ